MADALISAPVAAVAGAISVTMIAVATRKARESTGSDNVALMGVMGAFVFVAQMINFSIPGTGSSGHIVGGILLAAMLGPWRGLLTLCTVLIVQCLVFADGGLVALGCNILNMGVMSCLVAYPLIYEPLTRRHATPVRTMCASVLACVVGLELGALLVVLETTISGVTLLPAADFMLFMLPIHLAIGVCEGVATGLVLLYVRKEAPAMLNPGDAPSNKKRVKRVMLAFLAVAAVLGLCFWWLASGSPDGLEWSIMKITGDTEIAEAPAIPTALMPDYSSNFSGIIGAVIVMAMLWAISALIFHKRRSKTAA